MHYQPDSQPPITLHTEYHG